MEGFGKAPVHDSIGVDLEQNSTLAKRCIRARGAHDLETMQHVLSAVGSSYRWSMMRSRISGGRKSDIVVLCHERSNSETLTHQSGDVTLLSNTAPSLFSSLHFLPQNFTTCPGFWETGCDEYFSRMLVFLRFQTSPLGLRRQLRLIL